LTNADLQFAQFRQANLAGANLAHTALQFAQFSRANLAGANLQGAQFFFTNLTDARYDARTRWPATFNPRKHGAILTP
jgi:uncharacterized protein YjbI with pentapeptide repeats